MRPELRGDFFFVSVWPNVWFTQPSFRSIDLCVDLVGLSKINLIRSMPSSSPIGKSDLFFIKTSPTFNKTVF